MLHWRWGGINHKGATQFPQHVDDYIKKEIEHGAVIGPFEAIPFKSQVAISAISTRPKKDSMSRRIILDCSWPIGSSLNDRIDKNLYLGTLCNLKYPTIDMVARKIYELKCEGGDSKPIYLFREDMDRAFRQINACPGLVPLLGFRWRNVYYFNLVMVMGCCIVPYICQHTTDMLVHIHTKMGYFLLNCVDDFLGIEFLEKIHDSHNAFIRMLRDMGVSRSKKKSIAPMQIIEFIGNLVDAQNFTLGITPQRKINVLNELEVWQNRNSCS